MYNEPYTQILETLGGVYRNSYELISKDKSFEKNISITIVCDGYEAFNKNGHDDPYSITFADRLSRAGIYNEELTRKYFKRTQISK